MSAMTFCFIFSISSSEHVIKSAKLTWSHILVVEDLVEVLFFNHYMLLLHLTLELLLHHEYLKDVEDTDENSSVEHSSKNVLGPSSDVDDPSRESSGNHLVKVRVRLRYVDQETLEEAKQSHPCGESSPQ